MTSMKKRSLVMLVISVALLGTSLFAANPAQADDPHMAHFHGGDIVIGDDTIFVEIDDCLEGSEPDGLVLFEIKKAGEEAAGEFHCSDIDATGPLGDAIVDLLCEVVFEWPLTEDSSADFLCLMHIFIQTVLGDFLCFAHGHWTAEQTEPGHWYIPDASPNFDPVIPTGQCSALIAGFIDSFIAEGVEALLNFLFTLPA